MSQYFDRSGSMKLLPGENLILSCRASVGVTTGRITLTSHRFGFHGRKFIGRGVQVKKHSIAGWIVTATTAALNVAKRVSGTDAINYITEIRNIEKMSLSGVLGKNIATKFRGSVEEIIFELPMGRAKQLLTLYNTLKTTQVAPLTQNIPQDGMQISQNMQLLQQSMSLDVLEKEWNELVIRYEVGELNDEQFIERRKKFLPYLHEIEKLKTAIEMQQAKLEENEQLATSDQVVEDFAKSEYPVLPDSQTLAHELLQPIESQEDDLVLAIDTNQNSESELAQQDENLTEIPQVTPPRSPPNVPRNHRPINDDAIKVYVPGQKFTTQNESDKKQMIQQNQMKQTYPPSKEEPFALFKSVPKEEQKENNDLFNILHAKSSLNLNNERNFSEKKSEFPPLKIEVSAVTATAKKHPFICEFCGKTLPLSGGFCPNCGNRI